MTNRLQKKEKTSTLSLENSTSLLKEVRELMLAARKAVVRNINTIQVIANFEIGRKIVDQEQKGAARAQYGEQLILDLSAHLTAEFGLGFSERNLRNVRKFYLVFQHRVKPIWQTASAKLIKGRKCQDKSAISVFEKRPEPYIF